MNDPMHPLPYRILWTWDSWICDPHSAESFVSEYKRLIDWMAQHDYNGLILWGFLRDCHGGEEAARAVATHGRQCNVRVLPGVGAGGYGGFALMDGHPYNLETLLRKRPELGAHARVDPGVVRSDALCLYQDEALQWIRDGARWLAESFDIGGVNIETNEMDLIDVCPLAAHATQQEPNRLRFAASYCDLARVTPVIHEELLRSHPDAWVTYATYEPMWWERLDDTRLLASIPDTAIAQWNAETDVNHLVPPPTARNISLIHAGGWSYHLDAFPAIDWFTQYRCFYPDLELARTFGRNLHAMKMDGFALGNVGAPSMPDNELVYLAYIAFSRDPDLSMEAFSEQAIAPLYGAAAEPLVLDLMQTQASLHRRVGEPWQRWAWLLRGNLPWAGRPKPWPQDDIEGLDAQQDFARRAHAVASASGRTRLEIILTVLNEYALMGRLSRDPSLADVGNHEPHATQQDRQAAAMVAATLGLPDEIYHYGDCLP